ncbi:hypothetical protein OHA21_16690 [Actinoplanes sp. NBC_00393]
MTPRDYEQPLSVEAPFALVAGAGRDRAQANMDRYVRSALRLVSGGG